MLIQINPINQFKWKASLYKNNKLLHTYIDTEANLLSMCRMVIDICKDSNIKLSILYKNEEMKL